MNMTDMEKELEDVREMVLHIRGELYSRDDKRWWRTQCCEI